MLTFSSCGAQNTPDDTSDDTASACDTNGGTEQSYTSEPGEFTFRLNQSGTYTVYCKNLTKIERLEIPSSYNGIAVTEIGRSGFCDGGIEFSEIIIPDSITHFGPDAFKNCVGLKRVTLPKDLISIRSGSFEGCTALESVTVPTVLRRSGLRLFADVKI